MPPPKILIIGSGIAGPGLATLLLQLPLPIPLLPQITLLERSAAPTSHGQNIDVRGTGIDILPKLGVEAAVRAATTGEEGVRFVDSRGAVWSEVRADKTGRVQTGTSDVEILRGRLAGVLEGRVKAVGGEVEALGGMGVRFVFGDVLAGLEQEGDGVRVRFAGGGEEERFDLVVGADGLGSATRKMVWGLEGEEERVKALGAFCGFFSMPRGETDGVWRRWYHATGRRSIMVRPSGRADRSTVLMIVVNDDDPAFRAAAKVEKGSVRRQKALLGEVFGDAGWESERLVAEMWASDDFYYDAVSQVKLDSWSKGRVVLLGDAG